jgi:hypothetical protein
MSIGLRSHHVFPNVLDASRGLLIDACRHLTQLGTNYVVVGGWVPVLRCKHDTLAHPGTKDVDILLNDQSSRLEDAVQALLAANYLPSAKHPFQLLKRLTIQGQNGAPNREFVFNVDLMHPSEEGKRPDMFQDIMDLHIFENYDPGRVLIKSIAFPSSAIVFEENLWSTVEVQSRDMGNERVNIPLLNEAGLILSKCDSVRKKKRERDAFDIYYALTASNGDAIAMQTRLLGQRFPQVQRQLDLLKDFITGKGKSTFNSNVLQFIKSNSTPTEPATVVSGLLFESRPS